jgi:type IV pilus assembly protein PilV
MNKKNNESGFSLVELLIAMTILAIGILAVATMQITSLKNNAVSFSRTEATTVAQSTIEDLLARDYEDPLLKDTDADGNAGLMDTDVNADFSSIVFSGNRDYQVFWNISEEDPIPDTLTINVIVQWTYGSTPRTLSMTQIKGG